jgi:D-psicose/D-tagatose/L-ribulose 3-epimerase
MKLAVSNLAWDINEQEEILSLLPSLGVSGVEVAPTKIANWENIKPSLLADFRNKLNDKGLCVSSLQAIFFGKPDAQLLGDINSFGIMCEHIDFLADIAAELGTQVAVFGAPKNRQRSNIASDVAFNLAKERFRQLGDICQGRMKIGIEPVPRFYGSDFILTAEEDLALVKAVNHPAVGLHLDTGCVFLGDGNIDLAVREGISHLIHFHVAEPELSNFSSPKAAHVLAAKSLNEVGYNQWIAIEMKAGASENSVQNVVQAVEFVRKTYNSSLNNISINANQGF